MLNIILLNNNLKDPPKIYLIPIIESILVVNKSKCLENNKNSTTHKVEKLSFRFVIRLLSNRA